MLEAVESKNMPRRNDRTPFTRVQQPVNSVCRLLLSLLLLAAPAAFAGEFRSIGENATTMYDAPSVKANKLFVASRYYPVEVIVQVDNWTKVRDVAGELSWVEKKTLSDTRTVVVTAALADVRQRAEDGAPLAFQARRGVALDVVDLGAGPWVKVRHRDGQTGFVRANQVWGL
jgi:SH3-like domain-containing protein